ncbi:MAG: hypothetical protein AB1489_39835 [Acidobacteriota bacterium]
MKCIVCGTVAQSEPHVSKGWRCIELDGKSRYYACPGELPLEGSDSNIWREAYIKIFQNIMQKTPGFRPVREIVLYREREGQIISELN